MKNVMLIIFFVCVWCGVAGAESHKVGPYPNYKGTVDVTVGIVIPTTIDVYINDPFGGSYHVAGRGGQEFEVTYETPLFAHSYVEFESQEGSPFDPETGDLILTEIWAWDLEPGSSPDVIPPTEGFDPLHPGVLPLPPGVPEGFFTGRSGAQFSALVQTVQVGDLPTMLPEYNVGIIMGAPDNVVYVVQATVPADEFVIESPSPYFLVDSETDWLDKRYAEWPNVHISGLTLEEGTEYLLQLEDLLVEGERYSPLPPPELPEFAPPELYVYEGDDDEGNDPDTNPDDAGLVMKWGDESTPDGERASAWRFDYGDPDLSNCIITVSVTPPSPSGINRISLGMRDVNGNIRSWWWNVPSVIPYGGPTMVTIDTTMIGLAATNPQASGFANSAAFDLTKVQSIIADENAAWVSGVAAPAPPTTIPALWNYWHNISVTPKLPADGVNSKWFVKYSQPPEEIEDGLINGWDEVSNYNHPPDPIMADDWKCEDDRPITDIHWWGSFKGWTQPHLPPILPVVFRIGIWTDVPVNVDNPYSHPGQLIWENECMTAVWNFAGYDLDPRCDDAQYPCEENEACFQWAQFLSQDEWFRQEPMADGTPNIYWLSIAAVYGPNVDYASPDFYPWGWKTRPHFFNDDAVRITDTNVWPPVVGAVWMSGTPVEFPQEVSWDLAFELTTNEPKCPGLRADLNEDCIVNLIDFSIMASEWLWTSP